MHWADTFAKQIIESGDYTPYWVDDMKTPSGRVHIGSVRAVLSHYFVYRGLVDQGESAIFSYVLEDHDPFDKVPKYLDFETFKDHLGKPLYNVPSPEEGYESYGRRWGEEYIDIFNNVGVHPEIIWGSELYQSGKMNEMVQLCLEEAATIREIYGELYDQAKPDTWYPFNVACEECGKIATTVVTDWDGSKVAYECRTDAVDYTNGCGYEGSRSPFDGAGKLPWKVEWPCKWKVIGVTVEGAGKDHMSDGGSHDFAKLMCERVLDYPVPFHFAHEFFLVGGRKMSSSKGVGSSAKEVSEIIPPYLVRLMVAQVPYNRAINFNPNGETIPDLFDDYDQYARAYWNEGDEKEARIFELSQVNDAIPEEHFLPRFREVARILQDPKLDVFEEFEKEKGSALTEKERMVLEERVAYAKIWLADYAPEELVFSITDDVPEKVSELSEAQLKYLSKVRELLESQQGEDPAELQQALYDLSKELGLGARKAFGSLYIALMNKTHGPQAAWFILDHLEQVKERLEAIEDDEDEAEDEGQAVLSSEYLSLDPTFIETYPSASVGYAILVGVQIEKTDPDLEAERQDFLAQHRGLTTQQLNQMPELTSYRKMYKEMGVSYHSRRPSPEALLRRIATGKGLYDPINTCVDAYNLVVMRNRVSAGVFDLDKLELPAVVKIAKGGERALYIGDDEEYELEAGEVAYFDQVGPYNLDYNYRDAVRTRVTEETKNIWINTEGVYEITPDAVEQTLEETIAIIQQYCGGEVVQKGLLKQ